MNRERTSRTLRQTSVDMFPSSRAWWWISASEGPAPSSHRHQTQAHLINDTINVSFNVIPLFHSKINGAGVQIKICAPILRVREASIVLNCCSLVCIRLARLQRIGGIVCVFLSEENSLEVHASWLLYKVIEKQQPYNKHKNINLQIWKLGEGEMSL